jgi:hypothetical protein
MDADFFTRRGIAVHPVPVYVLEKACHIVRQLEQGVPYWRIRGKRLQRDRTTISIPVGRRYRLLAVEREGTVRPCELLSHGDYNNRI